MATQTNKLGITTGDSYSLGETALRSFTYTLSVDGKRILFIEHEEKEAIEADNALIKDAFVTANKCGLLPSELLEQRNELLESLKSVREWYEQNREKYLGQETPICFSKALSVIQKATTS